MPVSTESELVGESDDDLVVISPEDVSDSTAENILPQGDDVRDTIKAWLKPTKYSGDGSEYQKHLSSHLTGTGAWIFETEAYRQWYDGGEHGILWIRGIPGAGKSVLASSIIHRLLRENIPVLWFFFRHTIDANHGPEGLLRDWITQLLQHSSLLQRELREYALAPLYRRSAIEDIPMNDLWRLLRKALKYMPRVYCVVDALDEMARVDLDAFLSSLDALGRRRPAEIKLIVTSRPLAMVEKKLRAVKILDVRLDKKTVEEDVSRYVSSRLDSSTLSSEMRCEIEQAVNHRADGLFLYAKLALDFLLAPGTDVTKHVATMPTDLGVMYTDLLKEHSASTGVPADLQELVLQLVSHATRPLRLLEIAEAIKTVYKPESDLGAIKDVVRTTCGPLLEILPDETVRVVHHSLTEYLNGVTSSPQSRPFPTFEPGRTNNRLALLCLSYLANGCLNDVRMESRETVSGDVNYTKPAYLARNQVLSPFTEYAGSQWPVHAQRAIASGHDQDLVNNLLSDLLVDDNLDVMEALAGMKMRYRPEPIHFAIAFDLRQYAKALLGQRLALGGLNISMDDKLLLFAAAAGKSFMVDLLLCHGAKLNVQDARGRTPLHLAVEKGHVTLAALLLDRGIDAFVDRGEDSYFTFDEGEPTWTPASRAFAHGDCNWEMAMVFHERLRTPDEFNKALHHAVYGGSTRVVAKLLETPVIDVNARINETTPLYKACSRLDAAMIELLVGAGADPDILRDDSKDSNHDYLDPEAVDNTASAGHQNRNTANPIVGAVSSARVGWNALHALASASSPCSAYSASSRDKPQPNVVARCFELLLAHNTNVHQRDSNGCTPLHLVWDAVSARSLLDGGADPNAINAKGETLLHITFDDGIVQLLVERADLDVTIARTGRTALLHAFIDDYLHDAQKRVEKATRLLDAGASHSAVDVYGNSTLHLAVGLNDADEFALPLIERLCLSGVDVNVRNVEGKTPLHMNGPGSGQGYRLGGDSRQFHPQVFQQLVNAGANLNLKDLKGQTVLFQLTQYSDYPHWHKEKEVIKELLKAGAKLNTLDSKGRTLLHAAASADGNMMQRMEIVDVLVSEGLDPTAVDLEGNTLMHEVMPRLAKRPAWPDVLTKLRDHGVSLVQPNNLGRTPLHILSSFRPQAFGPCSSFSGSLSRPSNIDEATIFDDVLALLNNVAVADRHGVTALHLASTHSEYLTRRLLEAGADLSRASDEGLTALHLAARSRQTNIIGILTGWLVRHSTAANLEAAINAKDVLNRTALYYAAASGRVESVDLLIKAGAILSSNQYLGSAWNGCVEFEAEEAHADWSRKKDSEYRRSCHSKRSPGETDAGGVILADRTRPERVISHREQDLPFPSERLDDIVQLLVEHTLASRTNIALLRTVEIIDDAIVAALDRGFDYTVACLQRARDTLETRPDSDKTAKLRERLEDQYSASADATSIPDKDALIDLLRSRNYAQVQSVLDVDSCAERDGPRHGDTLLHRFIAAGFTSLASRAATEENISKTEWCDERDREGYASSRQAPHVYPLIIAACSRKTPNMRMVKMLVEEKGVDVNARMVSESHSDRLQPSGPTALHFLAGGYCWWQAAQAIPYLVEHGADLEAVASGLTPLGYALQNINGPHFNRRAVETLLKLGANPNGKFHAPQGSYLSATVRHKDIFELLVQHGATVTQPTLVQAIRQQDVDLLRTMLANGADPHMRKAGKEEPERQIDENSWTTARHDPKDAAELYLLDYMATLTGREEDSSGRLKDNQLNDQLFHMLLDNGADPFARYERTTVLHRVMRNWSGMNSHSSGQNRYLGILLDQPGLRLETRDADGMTILLLACQEAFGLKTETALNTFQKLLSVGADIRAQDVRGRNAIHHLCIGRRQNSPAFARRESDVRDLELIVKKAPDLVNSPDDEGKPPLDCAITTGSDELPDALIAAGARMDYAVHDGNTFLHLIFGLLEWRIALDNSIIGSTSKFLTCGLSMGADISARNISGETPLFAYFRSPIRTVTAEVPLREPTAAEAEEEQKSGHKFRYSKRWWEHERLQHEAGVEKEHVVFALLEHSGADWLTVNNRGQSLLHIVAQDSTEDRQGRRAKRFEFLMGKGLDPRAEDSEHRTPLDLAAALGHEDVLALFKQD